jgi:hypothetical protein
MLGLYYRPYMEPWLNMLKAIKIDQLSKQQRYPWGPVRSSNLELKEILSTVLGKINPDEEPTSPL